MTERRAIPKSLETEVLMASRRRCCLCVFLNDRDEIRKGQIAHLNGDPADFRFKNLVWLCLEHHDEYDSRTSQSKGLRHDEVQAYRDRLYERHHVKLSKHSTRVRTGKLEPLPPLSEYQKVRKLFSRELEFTLQAWRYPLWQVANEPDLFAYKAGNRADGVCLIERIDLPDERIVIVCIEVTGNPGNSITNCVEELCFQVCERFEIPADRLVWLEHYDHYNEGMDWNLVTFSKRPPTGLFEGPKWTKMTPDLWRSLQLKPKKKLRRKFGQYGSKITKLFDWPVEAIP